MHCAIPQDPPDGDREGSRAQAPRQLTAHGEEGGLLAGTRPKCLGGSGVGQGRAEWAEGA